MHKKITIIICFLFCVISIKAQQNIYDNIDTTAMPVEESGYNPPIAEESSNYDYENNYNEKKYYPGWGEEVMGDTSINFNNFTISKDTLTSWKAKEKYNWIKNIDSALHAVQNKDKNKETKSVRNYDGTPSKLDNFFSSNLLKVFLWIVAIGFIGFIIYQLFLNKGVFGKASKRSSTKIVEDQIVDHLDNDFDELYNNAFLAGNTRLAMRYLFLKLLKKLDEKNLITFAADKTNSMYTKELPQAKRSPFAQIALYYEYIWYGNINVNIQTFDGIKNKVNEFLNSI